MPGAPRSLARLSNVETYFSYVSAISGVIATGRSALLLHPTRRQAATNHRFVMFSA